MRTLVLGASENPQRYSNIATLRLLAAGHDVLLIGAREGDIEGHPIHRGPVDEPGQVDTVTLYIGPAHQPAYYEYIVHTVKPRRVIFNPGTENAELQVLAEQAGILCMDACTLVLLSTGQYDRTVRPSAPAAVAK